MVMISLVFRLGFVKKEKKRAGYILFFYTELLIKMKLYKRYLLKA